MKKTLMNDTTLADAVRTELQWDPKVDPAHIGVSAVDGAVTLTGYVASFPQEHAAVRAAERVHGVRAVADELDVKLPTSLKRNDSDIAEEISREREWNAQIPESVEAEVKDGRVRLRGEVEWSFQREQAERAIRHLAGVRSVDNEIALKPQAKPEAAEVERRVEDAIERMADLDAGSVRVTTRDGTIRLHGQVHSLAERRTAQRAAESAPGVMRVENDLVVRP